MIDHDGPMPVYQQLAAILRDQIRSGEFPPGRPLPSTNHLHQQYGIAKNTVVKALRLLVGEGYIVGVVGRGMYVRPESEWPGR